MLLKAITRAVVVLASVNNLIFQNSKTMLNLELYTWNSNLTINYTNYDVPNTPKTAKGGFKDFQKDKKSINQFETKKFHDGIYVSATRTLSNKLAATAAVTVYLEKDWPACLVYVKDNKQL
jgi:hypothetical protein